MDFESQDMSHRRMMETLYWWGIASLFRCPVDPDPGTCDIALVGVPHSSGNGSTERDQHLGPRAVRHVSAHNRRYHAELIVRWTRSCPSQEDRSGAAVPHYAW